LRLGVEHAGLAQTFDLCDGLGHGLLCVLAVNNNTPQIAYCQARFAAAVPLSAYLFAANSAIERIA
jgi:hypothetical protein